MFRVLVETSHFKNCLNDMYLAFSIEHDEAKKSIFVWEKIIFKKLIIYIWWFWFNIIQKIAILLTSFLWGDVPKCDVLLFFFKFSLKILGKL